MADTAIIGLGSMGLGMARNMMQGGIALRGFDVFEPARDRFAEAGGMVVSCPAEAAQDCSLLVVMVVNADQARDVLFNQGAAEALAPGATVMLCSTVAPSEARAIGETLAGMGLEMLDAPVSGGQVGAEAGTLTFMASGSVSAFKQAAAALEAMAGKVHHLGDAPGMGATYKVVHQLAAGVHIAAAAELMALGEKAGCDPQVLFDIVTGSAGNSWMLGDRGPRMMMEDPPCKSSVDIFVKDIGLVLQTGREAGAALPLAALAHQMFIAASGMGLGKADDSQVLRAYEALAGKDKGEE